MSSNESTDGGSGGAILRFAQEHPGRGCAGDAGWEMLPAGGGATANEGDARGPVAPEGGGGRKRSGRGEGAPDLLVPEEGEKKTCQVLKSKPDRFKCKPVRSEDREEGRRINDRKE